MKRVYKQDGMGPHGQGAGPGKGRADGTGLATRKKKKRKYEDEEDEDMEEEMSKSSIPLVIIPGNMEKSQHPAKLSTVKDGITSRIPYEGHAERMKLAKMAADRMLAPKPESAKDHQPATVDHKGREAGQKKAYSNYNTGVSGMSSQAFDNFGRQTYVVNPSELGSSTPEK